MNGRNEICKADRTANGYVMRCLCVLMAVLLAGWALNQLGVFIVEKKTMTIGMGLGLILFAASMVLCKVIGLHRAGMKYVLLFFMIALITVVQIMLTYHTVIISVIPIVCASMYSETKKMAVYTYVLTVVSIVLVVFGGYYVGLCDANMALLTSQPLGAYLGENGTFTLNQVNSNPVLTLSLYFVFPRCAVCGVFVPLCISISRIIAESRLKEEEMRVLAEIDGMTGLYNRSKYLELVSDTYAAEEAIAVIFWDINGLKRTNDTYGHEVGDQLIRRFAESVRTVTSPGERVYRIGGDEFVMILRGGREEDVQKKLQVWRNDVKGRFVGDGVPLSVACGYACGSGSELEDLIRQADDRMYRDKQEHYRKNDGETARKT